jgi:hypothetical protein
MICPKCKIEYTDEEVHVCDKIPPASEVGITTVKDDDLKSFVKDLPNVVDDAVEAAEKKEEEIQKAQDITDKKGVKFDPKVHKSDDKGNPLFTPKTGRFQRKLNIPPEQKAAADQAALAVDPLMIEAQGYTDAINLFARGVIGDEALWQQGERDAHILAWYKFMQKYGAVTMNPIIGLVIVHAAIIGSRASKPRTQGLLKF